jgi:hypothetical protein
MQYVGGKQKSGGQHIADAVARIAERVGTTQIVEPFCGGLSVTYRLAQRGLTVRASDACEALIALYHAVQNGWDPPCVVDRETWERYRAPECWDPSDPMLAFCGFGCSRSGAWFSSFVHDYKYTKRRVPAATAARDSLIRKLTVCGSRVVFAAQDYRATAVEAGAVYYCDKPYEDALDYPAVGPFDHDEFWRWAEQVSEVAPVLVSERVGRPGLVVLDEWTVQRRLNTPTNTRRVERLFVHERRACSP